MVGRGYIGMEIDAGYYRAAARRLVEAEGMQAAASTRHVAMCGHADEP